MAYSKFQHSKCKQDTPGSGRLKPPDPNHSKRFPMRIAVQVSLPARLNESQKVLTKQEIFEETRVSLLCHQVPGNGNNQAQCDT